MEYVLIILKVKPKEAKLSKPAPKEPTSRKVLPKVNVPRMAAPKESIYEKRSLQSLSSASTGMESSTSDSTVTPNSSTGSSPLITNTVVAPTTAKRSAEEIERPAKKLKLRPRGLFNDESYCFINSTIQCLVEHLADEYRPQKSNVLPVHLEIQGSDIGGISRGPSTRGTVPTKSSLKADFVRASEEKEKM